MKVGELVERSGVPLPTIKYYLREGILPPGTPTGRNQADYGPEHLRRVRLIRALVDVGGLGITAVKEVLRSIDDPHQFGHEVRGTAHYLLTRPTRADRSSPEWRQAREDVLDLIRRRGWQVYPDRPEVDQVADALHAIRSLGQDDLTTLLDTYAETVEKLAEEEVGLVMRRPDRAGTVEAVITGTVLGEAILVALRRIAQEHFSAQYSR
ncbi:MAG: MerR family transcriptional regulator [Hamadaea sp.]|uniref:MerR family transcriptional regulator n=1 Tax=Hamadaea sp. TaxID=2024425 RepID=UPI0017D72A9A|nr:MerR family transcriptional regulator [Hamadaea sp.]NUT21913.1 MerR family transcriptional regulator [Hamadaea sp.]